MHILIMHSIRALLFFAAAVAVSATAACLLIVSTTTVLAEDESIESPKVGIVATVILAPAGSGFHGGLSDLTGNGRTPLQFWAITDRGPKVSLKTDRGKVGALLQPNFRPAVFEIDLGDMVFKSEADDISCTVVPGQRMVFQGRTGKPISGRPNGCDGDERLLDPTGQTMVAPDPNGIDSEGLARLSDGSLWLSEEYRPSLVKVSSEGVFLRRYVPQGVVLAGADCEVHDTLPARYGLRKLNRGFEAIAISPDESTLWALLQSPLQCPLPKVARQTGNVRMLEFDLQAERPVGEFIYRLGDPENRAGNSQGNLLEDGKLCAMAAIDQNAVLVLEQADDGTAKLYRCSFPGATNTLEDARPLESMDTLEEADVSPLRKSLVADLAPLMPQFAANITDGAWQPRPGEQVVGLKLEGLAIIDSRHIALINDNDFNVDHIADASRPIRQSCLWIISLSPPLTTAEENQ